MKIARAEEGTRALFESLLPADPQVTVRPMFGNVAAFCNGNMFYGVLGSQLFVRLAEPERGELLGQTGAALLEPLAGRPMKEYVTLPGDWVDDPDMIQGWVERSLAWAETLPEKKKKVAKKKATKKKVAKKKATKKKATKK